jgi:hypothetical protein
MPKDPLLHALALAGICIVLPFAYGAFYWCMLRLQGLANGYHAILRCYPTTTPPPPNANSSRLQLGMSFSFTMVVGGTPEGLHVSDSLYGSASALVPWTALGSPSRLGPFWFFKLKKPWVTLGVTKSVAQLSPYFPVEPGAESQR